MLVRLQSLLDLNDSPGLFVVVSSMFTASPCFVQCCRSLYAVACMLQVKMDLTLGFMLHKWYHSGPPQNS